MAKGPMNGQQFRAGDRVEVFYRFEHDGSNDFGNSYFPVLSPDAGLVNPRLGLTDSWQEAEVIADFDATRFDPQQRETWVRVRTLSPYWSNRKGTPLDLSDPANTTVSFLPHDVRPAGAAVRPLVSFFVVRWGGPYPVPEHSDDGEFGGWGDIGTNICDKYIRTFFEVVYGQLGPNYEVYSCFVSQSDDLAKVWGPAMAGLLKGHCKAAMYYLWPVAWRDCNEGALGYVEKETLFSLMKTMEAAGVPTRHPHPSNLYHLLASKSWTASMCLADGYNVPATVKVNRATIFSDLQGTAYSAAEALLAVKQAKYGSVNETPYTVRGVAKLGFSWEAQDVYAFSGYQELAKRLEHVLEQQGCLAEYVYVQEFVQNDCEIRLYLINGEVQHTFYSRFCECDAESGSFSRFRRIADRKVVLEEWFKNNEVGLQDAERQMMQLTKRWLTWLRCEHPDPPAVCRFDFFISLDGPRATVYTGELTEQGASMLGWEKGPQLTFETVLRECLRGAPPHAMQQLQQLQQMQLQAQAQVQQPQQNAAPPS